MLAFGGARLNHRVIDADVFALRVQLGELLRELPGSPGCRDLFQIRRALRKMFTQSLAQSGCAPYKHAAVPVIVPGGDELLRALLVWLFREARDPEQLRIELVAGFDVTVAGLRARGLNAHHHDVAFLSRDLDGSPQDLMKLLLVVDDVIGGKNSDDSSRVGPPQQKYEQREPRSGLYRARLHPP